MEADEVEDMLFGPISSQDFLDETASQSSEEEMLESPDGNAANTKHDQCNTWLPSAAAYPRSEVPLDHDEVPLDHDEVPLDHDAKNERLTLESLRPSHDRCWVIARVEFMLEQIVDGLLADSKEPRVSLNSRASLSGRRTHTVAGYQPKERVISFPGATAQEAWNFTVLLRILELVHNSLIGNTIMTKREIYYRQPELFIKQSVVDRYVDDLARTLGIPRSQLNVRAAAKGLVAGNFSITRQDGYRMHGMKDKEGVLVPQLGEHDTLDLTSIRWILIIEKEATFRALLNSAQWDMMGIHGLALTAKGYPDIASRSFLRLVSDRDPCLPMYALVDLDPDGIAILSTYKYSSYRLAHEDVSTELSHGLGLPNILWLGIKSHQISRILTCENNTDPNTILELPGILKLTTRDRAKAIRMLEWDLCAEDGLELAWRQQLQIMLMLNFKAEMQILDEERNGLVLWLSKELKGCDHGPTLTTNLLSCGEDMLF